jgi:pyruvate kinase
MERRAKIVATLGPSSEDDAILEQGPKIRTAELQTEGIPLKEGHTVTLTTEPQPGDPEVIPVDFPDLPRHVKRGDRILLDDGRMELSVKAVGKQTIQAEVVLGGILRANKGINLPDARLDIPGFTAKDEEDLKFGLENDVDLVAISFVRSGKDVASVRQAIERLAPERTDTPVIAKLERPDALDNLEEIIDLADGVMVARGDLGVEMSPEAVPIAQKTIIQAANLHGKLVITATQMLESMVENPRPTRAEATDVANAIFDGTDALMLSGETAAGKHPVRVVKMMDSIIREAEEHLKEWGRWRGTASDRGEGDALSITLAARELAHNVDVAAIAVFTQTGRTARLMSKASPRVPILGFTPNPRTYRRLALYWGVFPHLVPEAHSIQEMLGHVEASMIATTPFKPGQKVVMIFGFPVGEIRLPNLALLHTIGEST